MSKTVKRSLLATFIDTTPNTDTPTYERVGIGVSDMSIAYNPQVKTEQDITQDNAESEVTGYQPNIPVSQKAKKGDEVYDYVNLLRRKRAVFDDCKTTIINVDLYDGDAETGYKAEKQPVSVQIDDYGGAGSDPLTIGYTLNYTGDPIEGIFNPTTKTFTPNSVE